MNQRSFHVLPRFSAAAVILGCCLSIPVAAQTSAPDSENEIEVLEERTWQRELPLATFGYSLSLAVGDLNSFVDDVSFRGFEFSMLWPAYRSLFVGASFGYNGFFDEKSRGVYQLESAAVTAKLYRYADAWSFALASRYAFLDDYSVVRPYLGLRLGLEWFVTTTYVVDRSYEDSGTGLLIAPEAGLMVRMGRAVLAQLTYQFSFSTASTSGGDVLSYNGVQLGLALVL